MNTPAPNDTMAIASLNQKASGRCKVSSILRPSVTASIDVSKCETLFCRTPNITITPINHIDGQYFKVLNRSDGEVQFNARVEYLGTVYASPVSLAAGESLTVVYDATDNAFVATSFLSSSVKPSSQNNSPE